MSARGKFSEPVKAQSRTLPAWVAAAVLVLLTFLVYLPVLKAGYIWDDDTALTENPLIRSVSGLRDIWFSTKPFDYFPLTFTSFWIEWRLWGANPTGYHIVNVLLHTLGAILLWRVLLRLKIPGAWVAATIFALHPMCVASVAWVAERKNTLSLVFYLLSILWYLRFDSEPRKKRQTTGKWYWLSLLAFLLALLSKTSVVTLPFVLALCVWWRRHQSAEHGTRRAELIGTARRLLPYFVLAVILGLVTVWFQTHRAMSGNAYQRDGLAVRLVGGSWAVWFYLWKALVPVNLSMIYPRWEIRLASVTAYVPALLALGTAVVCLRFWRTWGGAILVGVGCFFVTLLPVLGFFDMSFFVYSRAADHLQYLALPGVIALVVGFASTRLDQVGSRFVAIPVIILLGVLAWSRVAVFKGQESLWRDTMAKNPNAWPAYNNLGMATKNPAEEFDCYVKALRLNPNYADAHNNLAIVLYQQGRIEDAISHFQEALRINPGSASAHSNLGGVLLNQGKPEEARAHLERAILINPNYVQARNNLGSALVRSGHVAEAAKQFEISLRLQPRQSDPYNELGNIAFQQGRFEEAVARYQASLRIKPDYFETHHNLGVALISLGRLDEAITAFTTALKLNPDSAATQYKLGETLLKQGRRVEAAKFFAAAVQNRPDSAEAHHSLALVQAAEQNTGEALAHLREAVRLKPEWLEALKDLAWMLATQPDSKLRDGVEAVRLAAQANELSGGTNVNILATLAAAQAEAGAFPEATRTAQQALELARASGRTDLAEPIEAQLNFYRAGRPFHGPSQALER